MGGKRLAVIVLLIAVIVAAGVVITKKMTSGTPKTPDWVLDKPASKIDTVTLEVVTLPLRDWVGKYSPDSSGLFKNPKTGAYTMADIMVCANCGAQIPAPIIPPGNPEEEDKIKSADKCPKCGKNPFGLQ